MSKTPRTDEHILHHGNGNWHPSAFVLASFARQLETELADKDKQLAEANRKLAERINDDQRYLVAPLCNAEKALDDCQAELAEARAEIERINHQRRAGWTEIERLKLVSQNQETVIAAQRRSAKAKDKLIEQMRDTLKHVRKYSCSHMQRTTHNMIDAALSAAERGE